MFNQAQGSLLLAEQIVEQCLAIVFALLGMNHDKMNKALLQVLFERLEVLAQQVS